MIRLFWIAFLLAGAGSAYAVSRLVGPLLIGAVIGLPLLLAALLFGAIDKASGLDAFMNHSYQFVTGLNSADDVWGCHYGSSGDPLGQLLWSLLVWLFLMLLCVVNAILGFAALVGLPIGSFMSLGGAVATLGKRIVRPRSETGAPESAVVIGLPITAVAIACLLAAGLCLRAVHDISTAVLLCGGG